MPGLLALVLALQAPDLGGLIDPARAVRERAIRSLAEGGVPTAELASHLLHDDERIATGVAEALARRQDRAALAALARCADHPGAARGAAAARAAVAIALRQGVPLESLHFDGMEALPGRLESAFRKAAVAHLSGLRGMGTNDRPQLYRDLFLGGRYATSALADIFTDADAPVSLRDHAAHAFARQAGKKALGQLTAALTDPSPGIRAVAAGLVLRYGSRESHEALARLLGSGRYLRPPVHACAVAAVELTGLANERALEILERTVADAEVDRAVAAAAALREVDPDRASEAITARLRKMDGATSAALFHLREWLLDEEELARFALSRNPLLQALGTPDGDQALAILRSQVARKGVPGAGEYLRMRVLSKLLVRLEAPFELRAEFARAALTSDQLAVRRFGLRVLHVHTAEQIEPLAALVRPYLRDRSEATRVAAACLLVSRPEAAEVLVQALYDGDPRVAETAAMFLVAFDAEWPIVDFTAPVRERRALALDLKKRIALVPVGKE